MSSEVAGDLLSAAFEPYQAAKCEDGRPRSGRFPHEAEKDRDDNGPPPH